MNRWPEAIGLALSVHAAILLMPFASTGDSGARVPPNTAVSITLLALPGEPPPDRWAAPPPRAPLADRSDPGLATPTVHVAATDRSLHDVPALASTKEPSTQPEPEPEALQDQERFEFVRADAQDPLVEAPDARAIADRNLAAEVVTRREVTTTRIGPTTNGDPTATDVAGAASVPDTVSVPRVSRSENEVPLQRNREDPSRPGQRSGGTPLRSQAEAPEAPEVGAPGGHDQERKASRGAEAVTARGVRAPGEAGDNAPTRDGLASASEGDFPVPSTGGADPGDPRPDGPDRPSRADEGVRPLLSPGILDWITPAESADGGQPRSEPGDGDRPVPRAGEGDVGEGQTHRGDATGTAEANPGEPERQQGSRAAAGGTGSARLDRALIPTVAVPLDLTSAFNAVETPLGRYAASIDQALRDSWTPPLEALVMTGYGVTVVKFRVDHKGHVSHRELTRMSGVPGLDVAALSAVPERLARPERDLIPADSYLLVTYAFRHNSPIVSRSASR